MHQEKQFSSLHSQNKKEKFQRNQSKLNLKIQDSSKVIK